MNGDAEKGNVEQAIVPAEVQTSSWMILAMRRQNHCFGVAVTLAIATIAVFFLPGSYGFTIPQGESNKLKGTVRVNANNANVQEALEKTKQSHGHAWGWVAAGQDGSINYPSYEITDSMVNHNRTHPGLPTEPKDGGDYSKWQGANVTKASGIMYEIVEQLPHDPTAFTQGLTYANGILYESTGVYGQSTIRALDPVTGKVQTIVKMSKEIFAEGMVYYHGKLIQITWENRTGYIWDASNLTEPAEEFTYKTTNNNEGWGITHDPKKKGELIVSDGSDKLIFWDSKTFEILRTVSVTRQSGAPARYLNELEFWRNRVLANVWYEDVILVIHPETGLVEKEYDFSSLWPKAERPLHTDCFNGISVTADPDVLFVTGKYWNRMYRLKLLPLQ